MNLRLSEFCHVVPGDNGLVALYNALSLGVVIVDKGSAGLLNVAPGSVIPADQTARIMAQPELSAQLLKHKIVMPSDQRVDLEDYLKIQKGLRCQRIGIVYLLMTDRCNLACRYCFVENGIPSGYQFSAMTEETVQKGIDLFAAALAEGGGVKEPQVIFYGGEPLLNLPVLRAGLNHVKKLKQEGRLPSSTSITINTNGTLISEEAVTALRGVEKLNIAISLDGPEPIHDICRIDHSGGGSFRKILRGWELLRDHGIEAGFCCTISRHNVDSLVEIAKWFVATFGVKSMGFNIMIENDAAEDIRGSLERYATTASRKIIECFRYFREQGVYEDRIMRKVNAFVDGTVYYHDCGGCGQQLVVEPNGMVGVCQGFCGTKENFVMPDQTFNPLGHPIWEEWRQRSPLNMPQCRNCIALSVCGGGCPYSAKLRHGSIWDLDDVFCIHAKATVEFLLQDLLVASEVPVPA